MPGKDLSFIFRYEYQFTYPEIQKQIFNTCQYPSISFVRGLNYSNVICLQIYPFYQYADSLEALTLECLTIWVQFHLVLAL